jgi:soluble lytic murein transglycosylase-like protein
MYHRIPPYIVRLFVLLAILGAIGFLLAGCQSVNEPSFSPSTPRKDVAQLVKQSAAKHSVPASIAVAVTHVESRFRCNAIGPMTRYGRAMGPLQILPTSARGMFAYDGPTARLATCEEGLEYGMRHLARCFKLAGGDPRATAHCHVQGPHRNPFQPINAYARNYGNWVMAQYRRDPSRTYFAAYSGISGVPNWSYTAVAMYASSLD